MIGLIVASSAIYYIFNMPRRNISKEKAVYTLDAQQLISDFKKNEDSATKKYIDNTIDVTGEIKSVRTLNDNSKVYSLEDPMQGVSCSVDSADVEKYSLQLAKYTVGSKVTFKGRCSGMLMDVQVINCVPQ